MKVIFEYEDGTYRVVPLLKLSTIEERTKQNCLLDEYISQEDLVNKYIVPDDAHLGGFKGHKDILLIQKNIEILNKDIELQEKALNYYMNNLDKSDVIEYSQAFIMGIFIETIKSFVKSMEDCIKIIEEQ